MKHIITVILIFQVFVELWAFENVSSGYSAQEIDASSGFFHILSHNNSETAWKIRIILLTTHRSFLYKLQQAIFQMNLLKSSYSWWLI